MVRSRSALPNPMGFRRQTWASAPVQDHLASLCGCWQGVSCQGCRGQIDMVPARPTFASSVLGWGNRSGSGFRPHSLRGSLGRGSLRRTERNRAALGILILFRGRPRYIRVEGMNYASKPTHEGCLHPKERHLILRAFTHLAG